MFISVGSRAGRKRPIIVGNQTPINPGGRLTLGSGTPILDTSTSLAGTLYYTPYCGGSVPLWDGSKWTTYPFTELANNLTDTTKNPAATVANAIYDVFVWNDAGVLRISRSLAWSSSVSRNGALQYQDGHYLNATNLNPGPPPLRGLYLGTVGTDGSNKLDFSFGTAGNPASGGLFGVWNRYNKVRFPCIVQYTNTASWTYASATLRQVNGGVGLQSSWISGIQEDYWQASYGALAVGTTTGAAAVGIGLDSTTSIDAGCMIATSVFGTAGVAFTQALTTTAMDWQFQGLHSVYALEWAPGATGTITFNSAGAANSLFEFTFTG